MPGGGVSDLSVSHCLVLCLEYQSSCGVTDPLNDLSTSVIHMCKAREVAREVSLYLSALIMLCSVHKATK